MKIYILLLNGNIDKNYDSDRVFDIDIIYNIIMYLRIKMTIV